MPFHMNHPDLFPHGLNDSVNHETESFSNGVTVSHSTALNTRDTLATQQAVVPLVGQLGLNQSQARARSNYGGYWHHPHGTDGFRPMHSQTNINIYTNSGNNSPIARLTGDSTPNHSFSIFGSHYTPLSVQIGPFSDPRLNQDVLRIEFGTHPVITADPDQDVTDVLSNLGTYMGPNMTIHSENCYASVNLDLSLSNQVQGPEPRNRYRSHPYVKYGPYTCPICKQIHRKKQSFAAHIRGHRREGSLPN